jgi:hypothetical protein
MLAGYSGICPSESSLDQTQKNSERASTLGDDTAALTLGLASSVRATLAVWVNVLLRYLRCCMSARPKSASVSESSEAG